MVCVCTVVSVFALTVSMLCEYFLWFYFRVQAKTETGVRSKGKLLFHTHFQHTLVIARYGPQRTCAASVTVLGLRVCPSRFLPPRAMRQQKSDTKSFGAITPERSSFIETV